MNRRSHEIRLLLDHISIGGALTADDLAALRFPDSVDRAPIERGIREAASKIAGLRSQGMRGQARQYAREAAAELIEQAGPPLTERQDLPDDPRGLAALIRRA